MPLPLIIIAQKAEAHFLFRVVMWKAFWRSQIVGENLKVECFCSLLQIEQAKFKVRIGAQDEIPPPRLDRRTSLSWGSCLSHWFSAAAGTSWQRLAHPPVVWPSQLQFRSSFIVGRVALSDVSPIFCLEECTTTDPLLCYQNSLASRPSGSGLWKYTSEPRAPFI